VWDKAVWIGREVGLKLPERYKPHISNFPVAEHEVFDLQMLFNKKDVVIFVVHVVAIIEYYLLGNGKEIEAFTGIKRDSKLFLCFSTRRRNRFFSGRDVPGYRNIPQVRPIFLRGRAPLNQNLPLCIEDPNMGSAMPVAVAMYL
jgi:hypothetical protein